MKNRWLAALAAATVLAVSPAWAQEPVFRAEIRGVQTLLDEVQAAGRGTTLESMVPFVRPMLMRALGVDFFALLQGDATLALTLYADSGLLDQLGEGGGPEAAEDLLEELCNTAVVVATAAPRDPAAFWRALEKTCPGPAPSVPGRAYREFRINGMREPSIYGADVPGGRVALCVGPSPRWTFRALRRVLADAGNGADRSLRVPGTLAMGIHDFGVVQAFCSGVSMAAEGKGVPPGLVSGDAFLWKSGEIGVSVGDDVLRFHFDGVCADAPPARALSDALRAAPPAEASAANAVNRPGALLAGIGYMGSELLDTLVRMQIDAMRSTVASELDGPELADCQTVFERVAADLLAAAGRIGDGAQGIVAMPHRGERGLPALALYLENVRGSAEARAAVARAAELGLPGWFGRYLGGLLDEDDAAELADIPVVLRKGDGRELPGAAVDAYVLELADDEDNAFVEEAGFTLPFALGTVEFAWLDSGALVVSTLAPADLDALVADAVSGNAVSIAATPCWNGLVEVPAEGDGKLVSCDYVRLADIARELAALAAEWSVAFGGEDFREDEWFGRFWNTMPADPMTLACRGWLGDDGHVRQETAFNLAPLREWGTRLVAAGIRGLGFFEPGTQAGCPGEWE